MDGKIVAALAVISLLSASGCNEESGGLVPAVDTGNAAPGSGPVTVNLAIQDAAPYHVHEPGTPFTVNARHDYTGPATVRYQWTNYRGQALTAATPLSPGQTVTIRSPDSTIGYYGLVFSTSDARIALPNREPGEPREYGFAVLSPHSTAQRSPDESSRFGTVHADTRDPHLPAWIKTTTWETYGATEWKPEMDKRRALGMVELPLIAGAEWNSDDGQPISVARLAALESRLQQYFAADPGVRHWELGLEENLRSNFAAPHYWANLAAKTATARRVANAVNPGIKLIYQIAETDLQPIRLFLASAAARDFDILALHPYPWPNFPTPETWLTGYLDETRATMAANGIADMPIWFTEVGAPHHGNAPGRFFGYPESGKAVKGLSRAGAAAYLVKMNALALHAGVDKLFWYNYRDKGGARDQAEEHFGLLDHWGYPKPVYPAYANLHARLTGKQPSVARRMAGDVWVRSFRGSDQEVYVVWTYPAAARDVPWTSLDSGLTAAGVVQVTDVVGAPLPFSGDTFRVDGDPLFVVARRAEAPP
jgi:hypothetical protein